MFDVLAEIRESWKNMVSQASIMQLQQIINKNTMRTRNGITLDTNNNYNQQAQTPGADRTISTGVQAVKNWSIEENAAYVQFLKDNQKMMKDSRLRRSSKIFLEMSMFLRTKYPEQCRTHHQKVLAKYGSIEKIIVGYLPDQQRKKKTLEGVSRAKMQVISQNKNICSFKQKEENNFILSLKEFQLDEA